MAARKVILSVSISHEIASWLAGKKKKNINISAFLCQIIEEQMIKEMENGYDEDA